MQTTFRNFQYLKEVVTASADTNVMPFTSNPSVTRATFLLLAQNHVTSPPQARVGDQTVGRPMTNP
jgi:hypothetical protein